MRRLATRALGGLAIGLLLCAAGCLGRSPQPRYFVLGEAAAAAEVQAESASSIHLASALLPDYLGRQEMVRRDAGGELSIDAQHRWAGGLQSNALRALGARLAQHLGTQWVVVYPEPPRVPVDFRIDVSFDELVAVEDAGFVLRARWVIQPAGGDDAVAGAAALERPLASDSVEALVGAHEAVLDALAAEIARQVLGL